LFEFDGDGTFLRNIDLNDDAPCRNIRPEGMFVDGGGQVWVSLSTGSSMYAIPRGAQEGEFIQVGKNPVNRGDPTGYLQAFIVHPNLDFDGDGTANRQELQSGRNPFVGDE
jgi:hypothetical protein